MDQRFCIHCGATVRPDARFCGQCGTATAPAVTRNDSMMAPDFSVLEDAYLVRGDPELERRVGASLDMIANKGKPGIAALIDHLYKDMKLQGNTLIVKDYGDYSWNEWLKRRMIVQALGRAKARDAADALTPLASAQCSQSQFYEILQPTVVRVLAELNILHEKKVVDQRTEEKTKNDKEVDRLIKLLDGTGARYGPSGEMLSDSELEEREEAIRALGDIGDPRAIGPLMRMLDASDLLVYGGAVTALSKIGEPAIEPLLQALGSTDENVRTGAIGAFGQMGEPTVEALTRALDSNNEKVRAGAKEALDKIEAKKENGG